MSANRNFAVTVGQVVTAPTTIALPEIQQANRLALTLDVTAVSGTTPSLTASLEGQDAISGKWFTLGTFAAKTAISNETIFIGGGADTKFPVKSMRINISAVTGTTPSFTITIGANSHVD